jgi:glycerol-3-phosphate dehydrogenase
LLLDAAASVECAPVAAELLAAELGHDTAWTKNQITEFRNLAAGYRAGAG